MKKLSDERELQKMIDRLHEALLLVADHDVNLLSYKGQMVWKELAKQATKTANKI